MDLNQLFSCHNLSACYFRLSLKNSQDIELQKRIRGFILYATGFILIIELFHGCPISLTFRDFISTGNILECCKAELYIYPVSLQ